MTPELVAQSLWSLVPVASRARYIRRAAVAMLDELDDLARVLAEATGWPRAHIVLSELLPAARGLHALAQCAIYLALAPKSNAAGRALGAARRYIQEHGASAPPAALRSAAYPAARKLGRGLGYDYPHDHPGQVNDQEHLPADAEHVRFYDPGEMEPELRERLARIRAARRRDP